MSYKKIIAATIAASALCSYRAAAMTDIHGVTFDLNSLEIREDSIAILHEAAELMKRNPHLRTNIAGHACPSETGAQTLWFDRASAVRSFLLQHGVSPAQVGSVRQADVAWQASMRKIYKDQSCSESERAALFVDITNTAAR